MPEPAVAPVFYLHGFLSSSRSTKAAYFADRLRERGVVLRCPDLNEPEFEAMTLTRMLNQIDAGLEGADRPATLVGSSLGGALAVLAAARFRDRVGRLVLLAPAVALGQPGHHLVPPEQLDEWRRRGVIAFFHYGYGKNVALRYSFYEDSLRYNVFEASFDQPTLVFQGLRDMTVDPRTVEAFAKRRSNVTLSLVDDDHQLAASLPRMWIDIAPFLGLAS